MKPIKTALSIAVLNALSTLCRQKGMAEDYEDLIKTDAQDAVPMPKEKSVAVVGAFVPTLHALKARGGSGYHFLDRYADRIVTLKRSGP